MDVASLSPAGRVLVGIACALGPALPVWGLLLWIVRSPAAWRVAASRPWLRLVAALPAMLGSFVIPVLALGTTHAGVTHVDQASHTALCVAWLLWGAQCVLITVAVMFLAKRRAGVQLSR